MIVNKYPKLIYIKPTPLLLKDFDWVSTFMVFDELNVHENPLYVFLLKRKNYEFASSYYYRYNTLKLPNNQYFKIIEEIYEDSTNKT